MAAAGLQEFKQVLKNFRELGALAVKGTVAVPLLNLWFKFGPPPAAAIAVLTSGFQFLAVMWVYHFWHDKARKALDRRMKLCASSFVLGLFAFAILMNQFTIRLAPNREPIVEGFVVRSDVPPNVSTSKALEGARYDPSEVWTSESIAVIHVVLVACWMITFISFAMFISSFLIAQSRQRAAVAGKR